MEKIFVSYRRQDNRWATGRISDRLNRWFGAERVFRDIDDIEIGKHFPETIEETIRNSAVMLVIIGDQWATLTGEDGTPRILQPGDWVRREIEIALDAGVEIVPVLIEEAQMPQPEQVPPSFGDFCMRNAITITDANYESNMERLLAKVQEDLIHAQTGLWGKLVRLMRRYIVIAPLGFLIGVLLAVFMRGIGFEQVIASEFYLWPTYGAYDASWVSWEHVHSYSILFLHGYLYEIFTLIAIGLVMVMVYRIFRVFGLMLVFGLGAILGDILIVNALPGDLFVIPAFGIRIAFVVFWALIVQSESAQALINTLLAYLRRAAQPQHAFGDPRQPRRA